MLILGFFEKKKKESKERGIKYNLADFARDYGCCSTYLSSVLSGAVILSTKKADSFEWKSSGELKAEDLLEESIEQHKKWLKRQKKKPKKSVCIRVE